MSNITFLAISLSRVGCYKTRRVDIDSYSMIQFDVYNEF